MNNEQLREEWNKECLSGLFSFRKDAKPPNLIIHGDINADKLGNWWLSKFLEQEERHEKEIGKIIEQIKKLTDFVKGLHI